MNPMPPKFWLLPSFLPMHPSKMWCYCRMVYMSMSYLYGKSFVRTTPLIEQLREELYLQPYNEIKWKKIRYLCAPDDLYYPHPLIQDLMWDSLYIHAPSWASGWPCSRFSRSLLQCSGFFLIIFTSKLSPSFNPFDFLLPFEDKKNFTRDDIFNLPSPSKLLPLGSLLPYEDKKNLNTDYINCPLKFTVLANHVNHRFSTITQDVEMKEQEAPSNSVPSPTPSNFNHLKEIESLIETAAYDRESCRILRAIRLTMALIRKLKASILFAFLTSLLTPDPRLLFVFLLIFLRKMSMRWKLKLLPPRHSLPELEIYCYYLLVLIFLIDQKKYDEAKACSSACIARLKNLNRRTLDVLAARMYY